MYYIIDTCTDDDCLCFCQKSFHVLKQLEMYIGTKRCTLAAFLLACELKIFKWRLHSPRRNGSPKFHKREGWNYERAKLLKIIYKSDNESQ